MNTAEILSLAYSAEYLRVSCSNKVTMFTAYSAATAAAVGRRRIWVWLRNMPPSLLAALTKVKMQQDTQTYFAALPESDLSNRRVEEHQITSSGSNV